MRTWRKWLLATVGVVLIPVVLGAVYLAWAFVDARVGTVGEVEFDRRLVIPPLADSRLDDEGRRVFDLTLQQGEADLGRGRATPTWGVDGDLLGPTLRAERGEQVLVNVRNRLDEPSTLHWHGMELPAVMDGGPHQMVDVGATWSPTWEIDQPAATLWYHPHPHGATEQHVYRGIAGLFLIDDPQQSEARDRLPHRYGVDDIPLIVQDKRFDGHLLDERRTTMFASTGVLGDVVLVNGTPGPYLEARTESLRLRLLNGATARVFDFHFDDGRGFDVIASDGGLLPAPVRRDRLMLSPGERAEIVVRLEPGEVTVLRSGPTDGIGGRFQGADDTLEVLQLRAADRLAPSPNLPERLTDEPALEEADVVVEREFDLAGNSINGLRMDMGRIDHASEAGSVERWTVRGLDGDVHNFHVHGVQFTVAAIDGSPPPDELAGWKDTVLLAPGSRYELLVRLPRHTDPSFPYMYHCHILRHEDLGMMGQFVVVEPGGAAGTPPRDHDH